MVADFNIIFMRIYLEPIIWNGTDCFDGIIISKMSFFFNTVKFPKIVYIIQEFLG